MRRKGQARRPGGLPARTQTATIEITWRVREPRGTTRLLKRVARHTLTAEHFRTGNLSVVVVGARAMATLHRRYMNRPGPTDVLTFDLGCARSAGRVEAEVVLCADVARQQARARRGTARNWSDELSLYLVHGILHLAGYADHARQDFTRMHARETELLHRLGLHDVPPVER